MMKLDFKKLLSPICLVLVLAVAAGRYGGSQHWMLDLASHFLPHFALLLLVLAFVCVFSKKRVLVLTSILAAFIALEPVLPYLCALPQDRSVLSTDEAPLHFMQFNILAYNPVPDKIFDYIKAQNPDLVALEEVTPEWRVRLEQAHWLGFKYRSIAYYGQNVLLSRYPITWERAVRIPNGYFSDEYLLTRLETQHGGLLVSVIHPPQPTNPTNVKMQRQYFEEVAAALTRFQQLFPQTPLLLAGDFNATPWSEPYRQFKQKKTSLLLNSLLLKLELGYGASWPSFLGPFGIPIDHVWLDSAGGKLRVMIRQTGAAPFQFLGSDHAPVDVLLTWKKSPER
ncbi:MAG: endonuclease/exonuclease/phosphatase family protein [Vampirovibrionales bacterium]|nr:endonuclease/exonuclease/phosphatase family protein [Vampirovibrionales bacterium]